MSRAFSLTTSDEPEEVLKSSMSSLDSDTINEVVVASASMGEEKTIDMQKRKLESLKFQEELIEEEIESKDKKKDKEKEATAALKASTATTTTATTSAKSSNSLPSNQVGKENTAKPAAETKELTLQEIQALSDLARGSSVYREKSELYVLQAMIETLLVHSNHPEKLPDYKSALSPSPATSEKDVEVDKSLTVLRTALQSMVAKLHVHIDMTEKAVGDKLNVLDKDGDGELSATELKEAIVKLLRGNYSHDEAEALVNELDGNKDGKISLAELLLYIQRKKERLEASISSDDVKSNPTPSTTNSTSTTSSTPPKTSV